MGRVDAAGGNAVGVRLRRRVGACAVCRRVELHRLADREGSELAALVARPGAARVDAGRVLTSPARRRARGRPGGSRRRPLLLAWSPLGRGVLTGKYRTGIPADSRAASDHLARFVEPYLGVAAPRGAGCLHGGRGVGRVATCVALAWVRDRPVWRPRSSARARPRNCWGSSPKPTSCCRPRYVTPSTMCRRPRSAIPNDEPVAPRGHG